MILPVISWWLISTLLAGSVFPFGWRVFGRLSDRGLGLLRTLGLVLCGYGFWLGASLQILPNTAGGAIFILLILTVVTWSIYRDSLAEIRAWVSANWRTILVMEAIFLLSFVGWAWVRANNPEITGTEKPMELAFINSILSSENFPPRDPWLSGYAISYYYFGYVILSVLARLSSVSAGIAFNLGNSLWFALIAVGSYSLLYNWINRNQSKRPGYLAALLGPLLTLISGNLAGFLELLHSRYIFWSTGADGILRSSFWSWLGLQDLENAPIGPPSWFPQRYLWWWRSSRVIRDLDLRGVPIGTQSIDEFPFFSFLLADNHPHVLALPVALLALAFSLQLFLQSQADPGPDTGRVKFGFPIQKARLLLFPLVLLSLIFALVGAGPDPGTVEVLVGFLRWILLGGVVLLAGYLGSLFWSGQLTTQLDRTQLLFAGWVIGSLAFLNTWDFLPYFSVIAFILIWGLRSKGRIEALKVSVPTLFIMTSLGVLFYIPWYPTFTSQLGGILPHLLQPTRFPHFVTMFGPSLIPISIGLLLELRNGWRRVEWRWLIGLTLGIPLILLTLSWLLAFGILFAEGGPFSLESILGTLGVDSMDALIRSTLRIRLTGSWTALTLGGILASTFVVLRRQWVKEGEGDSQAWIYVLILIGALLIIGPEFLYLRDQFGLRMNTIFKFYYAAWMLWSLAAAALLFQLWKRTGIRWVPLQLLALIPLLMGLVYPVLSLWTKTQGFNPTYGRTLDGSMHPSYMNDEDRQAIEWINENLSEGVISEAVGGSYTYYGRVSTHSGMPTILGWPGHEGQWRGGYSEQGTRQDDLRILYQSPDWPTAKEIIDRYGIDYVYVGTLERQTYPPVSDAKFDAFMQVLYTNNSVQIYGHPSGGMP